MKHRKLFLGLSFILVCVPVIAGGQSSNWPYTTEVCQGKNPEECRLFWEAAQLSGLLIGDDGKPILDSQGNPYHVTPRLPHPSSPLYPGRPNTGALPPYLFQQPLGPPFPNSSIIATPEGGLLCSKFQEGGATLCVRP